MDGHEELVKLFERILRDRDAALEKLHKADEKWQEERDRRYAEVKSAEEKALKVKEQADRDALGLAREIQTYKDEKANELREQINSERGLYATKDDVDAVADKFMSQLRPLSDYIAALGGQQKGIGMSANVFVTAIFAFAAIIAIISYFVTH